MRTAAAAALIGVVFLSPLGDLADSTAGLVVQYVALLVSIGLGLWGSHFGTLDKWRKARERAENQRTELFRDILSARDGTRGRAAGVTASSRVFRQGPP